MTYLDSWEEFEQAAERLYLQDPKKCRYKKNIFYSYFGLKKFFFEFFQRPVQRKDIMGMVP